MIKENMIKLLTSGFWLIILVLLWNVFLANKLPEPFNTDLFDKSIPNYVLYSETIFRILVFFIPILIKIGLKKDINKIGLVVYIMGVIIYFISWLLLIYIPNSSWSTSLIGFMAPAYTPILWLIGLALLGEKLFINLGYKPWIYIVLSVFFIMIHSYHTYLAYNNYYR